MGLSSVLILALAVYFAATLQEVNASCELSLRSPQPYKITRFGSMSFLSDKMMFETREIGETIEIYCAKGFEIISSYDGQSVETTPHMKFMCSSNNQFSTLDGTINYINAISCSANQGSTMYESRTPMPGCVDYMSLVVGQNLGDWGSIKRVAICYDLLKQQLKHVSYTAYPTELKIIKQTQVGQLNDLGLDIEVAFTNSLFNPVSALDFEGAFIKNTQLRALFTKNTFEYTNLIQDKAFQEDILQFHDMLSIVWLRALLNGNWRHVLNALKVASVNATFDVRVGYSGSINLPQLQGCNDTVPLTIELDSGVSLKVPAHIWAHIRPLEPTWSGIDEFVVVAHNSPFLTSNVRDGFCKSICNEVSWLRNSLFSKLQHYPTYGLVQCCHVADVQHKLDNFVQIVEPEPIPIIDDPESSGDASEMELYYKS